MYIARILYPIEVLGPGKRVGIWFSGCDQRCPGCSNPELWAFDERYQTSAETVAHLIAQIARTHKIDGFTLTGGDPLCQAEALEELVPYLLPYSHDILVYTGYRLETIKTLPPVAVLIDGEYVQALNTEQGLIGSTNQRVILLDERYRVRYHRYLKNLWKQRPQIQNFESADGHLSIGIHRPDFLRRRRSERKELS